MYGKVILASIFCITLTFNLAGQRITINGYIRDETSLEGLPYATLVLSENGVGKTANQYGYYSLVIQQGHVDIEVSYVGYESIKKSITILKDTTINFYLKAPSLGELIVKPLPINNPSHRINRINLSMTKVKEVPPFLGEYDLIKALALTPGVTTSGEGSSGLIVRGGSADQNLVLLDGATVYNNSHLFGFVSNFNTEAIANAELIKGGFSSKYGGRLSSILNVTMKEGNLNDSKNSFTIGPVSSQFTTEGPIIKEKASYIISGRATYLTLITLPIYLLTDDNSDKFNYFMYDFNVKTNYIFNKQNRVFLSFYTGSDLWDTKANESDRYTAVKMAWNNMTASLRYTSNIQNRLFSISQLVFNRFVFSYEISEKPLSENSEFDIIKALTSSSVQDIAFKQNFEYSLGPKNKSEAGFEIAHQIFHPDYYELENVNFGSNIPETRDNKHSFSSFSLYAENTFTPFHWLSASTGLRYSSQLVQSKAYLILEPRINLGLTINQNSEINIAYTRMGQPVFQLTNTGQGLPIEVWAPITKDLRPSIAKQISIGYRQDFKKNPITLQVEAFHKTSEGLIDYNQGVSFVTNITNTWDQNIVMNGQGLSYGLELLLSKNEGKLKGWIGYTLSRSLRRYNQINQGEWYPARYDRTHDLELTGTFQLAETWKASAIAVLSTGQPATMATTVHEDIFGNKIQVFTSRNNQRMPAYHRLDLAFTKDFTGKKKYSSSLSLGAYNVYNRRNPFYVTLKERAIIGADGQALGFRSRYHSGTLLGIVPFVSYTIKF